MLETCEERIRLLRAGLNGKTIEQLYIRENHFKLITASILKEMVGSDKPQSKNTCIKLDVALECTRSICSETA